MKYIFLLLVIVAGQLYAQNLPTITERTRDMKRLGGFLNCYWEGANGRIWLEIADDGREMLYQQSLPSGLGSNDIGLDRGLLGSTRIVKFIRSGTKLLLVEPNYRFRAVTGDAHERRAVEQSFAQSTLWGFTIEAATGQQLLVDATEFLVRDAMGSANLIKSREQGNYSFDKTRSAIYLASTKNFPQNTELESTITLVNTDGVTGEWVNAVSPSPEAITLRLHHSFVQLPDSGYQPRLFDIRSGFINMDFLDYSTPVSEPIVKRFIIRHRLNKKDPSARLSDPVKPIIYYLDNGTPEPIRSALLEGAGWWNQAFEAAGFRNAFQIKMLPDSADPMDIRYNVINWVHRATRGWSYGAAVVDPRTGEIIKGQVTLGSLRVRQDYLVAQSLLAPFENGIPAEDKMLKMGLQRLRQLAAHEVGHTLGLMHNYAANVSNRASVMDYPHPQVRLSPSGEIDLSGAYDDKIGEWDKVAIQWGYGDAAPGANADSTRNELLLAAHRNGLQYISDRDARAAGGLHPFAHLWDAGNDPVISLVEMKKVRNRALARFGENNIRPGTPMATLEDVLVPVYFYHRYQLEAVTKWVGGLNYSYALRGDSQLVTRPLTRDDQLTALQAVIGCLDPKFLRLPGRIIQLIPPRPAGYEFTRELFKKRTGLAFDALSPAEAAADLPLSLLFNTERLNRMVQYEAENGGLGAAEMIDSLVAATWKAPARKGMEQLIQQQTGQLLLTYLLAVSVDENASFETRAVITSALYSLKNYIDGRLKLVKGGRGAAHLLLALERMKAPEKAKRTQHKDMPPGAPIGCDWDE
jgi:hypothetical protein